MSRENNLVFPASIDLAGLDRDIASAEALVGDFADQAATRLGSLPAARIQVDPGSLGNALEGAASGMAASFLPLGGIIAASIITGLAPIRGEMKAIASTISKQLHDGFSFAQMQDSIRNTKDIIENDLRRMKEHFAAFSKVAGASGTAPFKAMKTQIGDAEHQLSKFLLHSKANFKKGGTIPVIDDLFTNQSRTYKGGKKDKGGAAGPVGSVLGALNPMRALRGETNSAAGSMLRLGAAAGAVVGSLSLLRAGFGFLRGGAKGASDLAETLSKVDVILGRGSGSVKAFADEMAAKFGLVKGTTLDTAASFAGLGRSLGRLSGDRLASFSTGFTKLAADLSSFSNIDLSAAGDAIRVGLSGNQSDQLKELGVVLTEDVTKQYAYAHGIAAVGTELNEQQKFMARAGLITQGLSKASGDLERTQGGAANQARKLMGSISNLATSIGTAFLPALTEGLVLLNEFGTWAAKTFEENKATVAGWADAVIGAFDYVVAVVHNFPSAFEVARLKIVESLINVGEWIAILGPNAVMVAGYIARNWSALLLDAFNATIAGLKNLWANFQAIGTAIGEWFADPTRGFHVDWTPLLDGFKATAEKFPELLRPTLTDMSQEIAQAARPIADEVASRRSARALGPAAVAQVADDDPEDEALKGKKDGKAKDFKFSAALELGSKEAYSSIAEAFSGAGRSKGMDALAQSGKQTAGGVGELVKLQREANKKGPKMGGKALVIA